MERGEGVQAVTGRIRHVRKSKSTFGLYAAVEVMLEPRHGAELIRDGAGFVGTLLAIGALRTLDTLVMFRPSLQPLKLSATFLLQLIAPSFTALLTTGLLLLALMFSNKRIAFGRIFSLALAAALWSTFLQVVSGWIGFLVWPDVVSANAHIEFTNLGFLVSPKENPPLNYLASCLDLALALRAWLLIRALPVLDRSVDRSVAAASVLVPWLAIGLIVLAIKIWVS